MAKRTRRPRLPRPPAVRDVTEALRRQQALADELDDSPHTPRARTSAPPTGAPPALPGPPPSTSPAGTRPALPGPPPSTSPAAGAAATADESARLDAWLEQAERRGDERARPPRRGDVARAPATGFWEGYEVAWMKLALVRLAFFGLLAADAFLQLAHAARYGAGGFNVPQLGWLPLGAPPRVAMIAIHAGLGLAFALIAQGVAVRVLLPAATVAYAYAYLASQLDSYQHHYLVALLLLVWCFVPRAPESRPPEPRAPGAAAGAPRTARSWAVRLVLVQLAIVYLWAAFAKVDPLWMDGTTLRAQVAPGWVRDAIAYLGFDTVAVLVVIGELALAATVWLRRGWWIALPLGVGLHVGIELVGLEIGLFSYLMLALYLLLVPDRVYHALDRGSRRAREVLRAIELPWLVAGGAAAAIAAIGFLAIPLPMLALPLAVVGVIAGAAAGLALRDRRRGRAGRTLAALAVALALPVTLARATDTVIDHQRYRAGDARRFGDQRTAREAYRAMLAIDPSSEYAHYYLGGLDAEAGALDAALAHYHAAQRAAPLVARSFVAEAKLVFARGELARAQALVRDALAADPEDADALALEKAWQSMAPAEGPEARPAPPAPAPAPAAAPPAPAPAEAPPAPAPAEAPPAPAPVPAEAPPAPGADGGR